MSTTSRQTVLALGLVSLVAEGIISHPAFAVNRVKLFKVTTPKSEIVIGLTKAELAQMQGKTADAVAKALSDTGELEVWQYDVRPDTHGQLEQAPVRKISITADPATQIEPYVTALSVAPVTDDVMIDAIR